MVAHDKHKWSFKALQWDPSQDPRFSAKRKQGGPKKRWTDDIAKCIHADNDNDKKDKHHGQFLTTTPRGTWTALEHTYINGQAQ